jgi:hypothetical protein
MFVGLHSVAEIDVIHLINYLFEEYLDMEMHRQHDA